MTVDDPIERSRVRGLLRSRLFGVAGGLVRIGRFEIQGRIGEGASGVVYRAHDAKLARDIALKVLHAHGSAKAHRRHEEEGRALARLSHPNVVSVYDVGEHEGEVFLAMQLVPGGDLRHWLAATPRRDDAILDVLALAGAGLAAAHREGLVHRDFKPENILVADGAVRVADFGLAALVSDEADATTVRVGTPAYMAPEQWSGGDVDARADQYAFALVALEALSRQTLAGGAAPVAADRIAAALARTAGGMRPWLGRALSSSPDARFASMDELLAAVARQRGRRRRAALSLGIGATLLLVGGLAVHALVPAGSPCSGGETRLAGVWDDARAAQVERAFAATHLPFAARSARLARTALDRYRDQWRTAHREICEATHVRHEQSEVLLDRRMRCLDRARTALGAASSLLASADASAVVHASGVVDGLPSIAACREARIEPTDVEPAAPDVERTLAAARAALAAGHFDAGRVDAEHAAVRAHALGARRLEAEARTALGQLDHELAHYPEAEDALFAAISLATAAGDHATTARAAIALGVTLGNGVSRYPEAERWTTLAEAQLADLTDRTARARIEAERELFLAELYRTMSRHDEAVAAARRAVELVRSVYGPDSPRLAAALTKLGFILFDADGCRLVEQARALRERVLGPDHPDLGESYDRLGTCAQLVGDEDRAAAMFEHALALRRAALGDDHRDVARTCFNFAWLRLAQDRLDDADQLYACARRGYAHAGNRHFEAAAIAGSAEVSYRARRYDESLARLDEAAAEYDGLIPASHGSYARLAIQRGNALLALGHATEARARYADAARISDENHESSVAHISRLGGGLAALAAGDAAGAVPLFERASEETAETGVEDLDAAIARFHLARALVATHGDAARARSLATAARASLVGSSHPERAAAIVADIDAWLAAPSLATRRSAPGAVSTLGAYRMRW